MIVRLQDLKLADEGEADIRKPEFCVQMKNRLQVVGPEKFPRDNFKGIGEWLELLSLY